MADNIKNIINNRIKNCFLCDVQCDPLDGNVTKILDSKTIKTRTLYKLMIKNIVLKVIPKFKLIITSLDFVCGTCKILIESYDVLQYEKMLLKTLLKRQVKRKFDILSTKIDKKIGVTGGSGDTAGGSGGGGGGGSGSGSGGSSGIGDGGGGAASGDIQDITEISMLLKCDIEAGKYFNVINRDEFSCSKCSFITHFPDMCASHYKCHQINEACSNNNSGKNNLNIADVTIANELMNTVKMKPFETYEIPEYIEPDDQELHNFNSDLYPRVKRKIKQQTTTVTATGPHKQNDNNQETFNASNSTKDIKYEVNSDGNDDDELQNEQFYDADFLMDEIPIEIYNKMKQKKNFKCKHCPAEFQTETNMIKHLKLHKSSCYSCRMCNYTTINRNELKLHESKCKKRLSLK